MAMKIVILEDNADRTQAMKACLDDRFPQYETRFFGSATKMVAFLEDHLDQVILISLDHDLELIADQSGSTIDPGTGRAVADYLVHRPPTCPVVIHTTNSSAALGMETILQESGWQTHRVVPYDNMNWIAAEWFRTVRRAIVASATVSPSKRGSRP